MTNKNILEAFTGSRLYSNFLNSFVINKKIKVDLKSTDVSEAIFFHYCKILLSGWRHKRNFNRREKHSVSSIFQDLVAYYLKLCLPIEYDVQLETKIDNCQPDILISKDGKYFFAIEIKTTIGRNRDQIDSYETRVQRISELFKIQKNKIIYVFADHGNVGKDFSSKFWSKDNGLAVPFIERETKLPFSLIFPLFNKADPNYWKGEKDEKKNLYFKEINSMGITDEDILGVAKKNICTPFEEILKLILN